MMVALSSAPSDSGAPATWLLLRGLGRERGHWLEFPARLESALGVRTLALDLPGVGELRHERVAWSTAAMARALKRRLGPRQGGPAWGVMGISLGGMVALSLAEQWPEGISHAVVINTSCRLSFCHQRLRPRAALALLGATLARDLEARERRLYALTTNASELEVSCWASAAAELARRVPPPRRRTLAAQLFAAARFQLPTAVTQPLLVLSGARDRLASAGCSSVLARKLGAAARCHPRAGHDLPLEDPDWVIAELLAWLAASAGRHADADR